jgi:hypothetical protein
MSRGSSLLSQFLWSLCVAATVVYVTGIYDDSNHLYSPDLQLRAQTEALLHGRLSLYDSPVNNDGDLDWGEGLQQHWGLGVPMLRLPFEFVSQKIAGAQGFPDRAVLLIFFVGVIFIFLAALRSCSRIFSDTTFEPRAQRIFDFSVLFSLFLFPAFLRLLAVRMEVYEEVAVYAVLWQFLIVSLLLLSVAKPSFWRLVLLSLPCAAAIFVRPTVVLPAFVALFAASVSFFRRHHAKTSLAFVWVIFSLGIVLQLATNKIRYGAYTEFGHSLSIHQVTPLHFSVLFDNPFGEEPLASAALELGSALFSTANLNNWDFFRRGIFRFQSPTLRFREFYFDTFERYTLILLVAGGVLALFLGSKLPSDRRAQLRNDPRGLPLLLWCLLSFFSLFIFYLRAPVLSSRYFLDFFPAVILALYSYWLTTWRSLALRLPQKFLLPSAVAMGMLPALFFLHHFQSTRSQLTETHHLHKGVSIAQAMEDLARKNMLDTQAALYAPPLPQKYSCGEDFSRYKIRGHGDTWSSPPLCAPFVGTIFFFRAAPCYELTVSKLENGPELPSTPLGWSKRVRLKENLVPFDLVRSEISKDSTKLLFCRPPAISPASGKIRMISVAWTTGRELAKTDGWTPAWVRLLSIERAAR